MTQDKQTIAVLGATSHLAQACSRLLAEAGHTLVLVGRNEHKLNATRGDLLAARKRKSAPSSPIWMT